MCIRWIRIWIRIRNTALNQPGIKVRRGGHAERWLPRELRLEGVDRGWCRE
ncbi:MAG: hypothetical protein ACK56F_26580 [bacterium]